MEIMAALSRAEKIHYYCQAILSEHQIMLMLRHASCGQWNVGDGFQLQMNQLSLLRAHYCSWPLPLPVPWPSTQTLFPASCLWASHIICEQWLQNLAWGRPTDRRLTWEMLLMIPSGTLPSSSSRMRRSKATRNSMHFIVRDNEQTFLHIRVFYFDLAGNDQFCLF